MSLSGAAPPGAAAEAAAWLLEITELETLLLAPAAFACCGAGTKDMHLENLLLLSLKRNQKRKRAAFCEGSIGNWNTTQFENAKDFSSVRVPIPEFRHGPYNAAVDFYAPNG